MGLFVRSEGVFISKVLAAGVAHVWPHSQMGVDVFLQQVFAAVPFAAIVALPRLSLG